MINVNDNFVGGQVIAAMQYSGCWPEPADLYDRVFGGLDCERLEIIFPATDGASGIGKVLLAHLKCKEKSTVVNAVQQLSANPLVAYAEANYLFNRYVIPNDPYFERLWGMKAIQAPEAWSHATGCNEVTVGVVDSGVDYTHPDIRQNIWTAANGNRGWNFYDGNGDAMDLTGHGTHVAGTIGAVGNNNVGVVGVCWRVGVAPMKIGNRAFDLAAAIASIDYARAHHIPILNCSWGARYNSSILQNVISQYDGLFIASAGNAGMDNDVFPEYPASFGNENIISVAATDPDGGLASYSNFGAVSVDIAAPGTNILSLEINGTYSEQTGTSMSAPHVAGAAALLMSYKPGISTPEMKQLILSSASARVPLRGRVATGGVLDTKAMLEMAGRMNS